ncbi:MAG TPA: hypothetical protein VGR34_06555 [Candidatus Dormibacteraeota bacterium]|nr:hypothetical protein [Candidatus Dormibacteraeota bacterium]
MNKIEVLKILQLGDTVLYVLKNREIRPLIVTRIDPVSASINGTLLFDGQNDAERLDTELRNDQLRTGTLWIVDVPYNEVPTGLGASTVFVPGTWHLPARMAAAAGRT